MRSVMTDVTNHAPLTAEGVSKAFRAGDGTDLHILKEIDFTLASSEAVAIVGASGAGKSTLLHLLGALDRPSAGAVRCGEPLGRRLGGRP